jgi:hypothetical protein
MCKAVQTAGGEPDEDKVARDWKRKRSSRRSSQRRKSDYTAHASSPLRVELTADLARYVVQPTATWEFEEVW